MCSPKLLRGCRLRHPRTSTRLGWRFRIDWILFILFTSRLRWSPRPPLHSWQPMRPASVSDKDGEISRARLSEVKSGEEGKKKKKKRKKKSRWWNCGFSLWLRDHPPPPLYLRQLGFFFDSFNRFKNGEQNDKSLSVLPPISSTPNTIRNFYKYPVCLPWIEFLFHTPQYRFLYSESGLGAVFKV